MSIRYFNGSTWERITREERFFCSLLYHDIKTGNNLERFIRFLNAAPSPIPDDASSSIPIFQNTIALNPDTYWEIGYEACFYRDMIYQFKNKTIGEINQLREMRGKCRLPHKRTFDLCLFSDDHIVIIEAKVQQGLGSKQCKEFKEDEKYLKELFKEINLPCPEIVFIVLASSQYFASSSFTHPNGVGKNLISDDKFNLKGFIAWQQIGAMFNDKNYVDADAKYGN